MRKPMWLDDVLYEGFWGAILVYGILIPLTASTAWFWFLIGTNIEELGWTYFQDPLVVAICPWAMPILFGGTTFVAGFMLRADLPSGVAPPAARLITVLVPYGNLLALTSAVLGSLNVKGPDPPSDQITLASIIAMSVYLYFLYKWATQP